LRQSITYKKVLDLKRRQWLFELKVPRIKIIPTQSEVGWKRKGHELAQMTSGTTMIHQGKEWLKYTHPTHHT